MTEQHTEDPKVAQAVQTVVSDNLDRVEAHLDSTVDSAKEVVHELRNEAEAVAEQALTRVQSVWGQMQQKLDSQIDRHPWLVLGSLLILGYVVSRAGKSRRSRLA